MTMTHVNYRHYVLKGPTTQEAAKCLMEEGGEEIETVALSYVWKPVLAIA